MAWMNAWWCYSVVKHEDDKAPDNVGTLHGLRSLLGPSECDSGQLHTRTVPISQINDITI